MNPNGTQDERRVAEERQHLSCAACGAGNRLASGVVDRGFQRCRRCDSPMPVVGAGGFAFDGPGFTHVVSPGRSRFVVNYSSLISLPTWILVLLLGDPVSTVLRGILRHGLDVSGPATWAPFVGYVLLVVALLLLMCVQQRIMLVNNRVEVSRHLFGLRVSHRRFGSFGLKLAVRDSRPFGLWMTPLGGRSVWIGTDGADLARALKKELETALVETRQSVGKDRLRCPGCGAPVATPLELVDRGGVECSHCGGGIVAVKGGVVLGTCSIRNEVKKRGDHPRLRRKSRSKGTEWRLGSAFSHAPIAGLTLWSVCLLLGGAAVLIGVGVTVMAEGWHSFGLVFALVFVPLGLGLIYVTSVSSFGRHRIRVGPMLFVHTVHLGPVRIRQTVLPLSRLLSMRAEENAAAVDLRAKTATVETTMHLPSRGGEGAALALEVLTTVRESVEQLGRSVEWLGAGNASRSGTLPLESTQEPAPPVGV